MRLVLILALNVDVMGFNGVQRSTFPPRAQLVPSNPTRAGGHDDVSAQRKLPHIIIVVTTRKAFEGRPCVKRSLRKHSKVGNRRSIRRHSKVPSKAFDSIGFRFDLHGGMP